MTSPVKYMLRQLRKLSNSLKYLRVGQERVLKYFSTHINSIHRLDYYYTCIRGNAKHVTISGNRVSNCERDDDTLRAAVGLHM